MLKVYKYPNFAAIMQNPVIYLKKGKERPVLRFHPWIFSGAIEEIKGELQDGDLVEVRDAFGNFLAQGHYQKGSIAVRILSFEEQNIDDTFWKGRIREAFARRRAMGFPDDKTNCFRLLHGEGDGLPGLIVDVYADVAVVQCHSIGMLRTKEIIAKAIAEESNGIIKAVFDKSAETMGMKEGNSFLFGASDNRLVLENGIQFKVDFETGQKTGFFLDQRDNRELLSRYCNEKSVLNTFCYTGGFSVYALKSGAKLVHSVDASKKAIELCVENVNLSGPFEAEHEALIADVPEWLRQQDDQYDVIILDPPAFAKHQDARHRAVQAYKRLNKTAIEQIAPNGILFTFSCSQVVDRELFRNTVTAAAIEAGRKVSILHQLTQPADHPVSIYHPEGEYLKGLVLLIH
ncbi:MAG: class I SAM-dependent rRNA methyltransferase [Bacteroidia bacterium]